MRPPALLTRLLAPLSETLWVLLLVWTVLVAIVWLGGIGDAELQAVHNAELRAALRALLPWQDALWITLLAANAYLGLVLESGLATARRWALMIIGVSSLIAGLSAATDWPLGPIRYSDRFGSRIARVPFALPLLWFAVMVGGRSLLGRLWPKASHAQLAFGVGGLSALTALIMEPLAWKVRVWWTWYPGVVPAPSWPPLQNYLTWFFGAALLAYGMRETRVSAAPDSTAWPRAAWTWLLFIGVLLGAHLSGWLRQ